jgi:hypothetical protein
LSSEEIEELLAPAAIATAPWLLASRISAAASREVACRHSEPDDRTAAQKAVHARSARRRAMEANGTSRSAWA